MERIGQSVLGRGDSRDKILQQEKFDAVRGLIELTVTGAEREMRLREG